MTTKNIMVFNVAAESVGALSILQDIHREVVQLGDVRIKWFFVLGRADLPESATLKVLRFPRVKKSWFHRLFFDWFVAPRLVKQHEIDEVLSLQNLAIPRVKKPQTIYIHQSLPFSKHRFSLLGDPLFWVYQNIIGPMIISSIRKAGSVIVQTQWMKRACILKSGVDTTKIYVIPPRINIEPKDLFKPTKKAVSTFFYPAAAMKYKNHTLILRACRQLHRRGVSGYSVIFTLSGDENKYAEKLFQEAKSEEMPIEFVGALSREEVFECYARSVLLFPSYIESFPLPLQESRLHDGIIMAADTPFAREILEGYGNAHLFDTFDDSALATLMERSIRGEVTYEDNPEESGPKHTTDQSVLERFIELIKRTGDPSTAER